MKPIFMFMLLWVGIEIFSSCQHQPTAPALRAYYYYPATNMYFNTLDKRYYFSLDGAVTWDSINASAGQDTTSFGERKLIYAVDSVWKDNDAHRRAYGGKLYNVLTDADTTAKRADAIVTEKVVQKPKPKTTKVEEEDKPRKGLGKFLKKIFGKKKDKK